MSLKNSVKGLSKKHFFPLGKHKVLLVETLFLSIKSLMILTLRS